MVTDAVSIPVIAAGGCGHPNHMKEVFDTTNASAVAVGNYFNFTEQSVNTAKAYLKPSVDVRLDTYAKYDDATFDAQGRVAKRPDSYLDKLRFEYYPKEII
jgi:cyclase